MKQVYTSIDIGSDTIKVVTCELYKNKLNLLAASKAKSEGIKRGLIVDPNKVAYSIKKAIYEVETQLGIKVKKVITNIPSYFNEFAMVSGEVEIAVDEFGNPGTVTGNDISKVLQVAVKSKMTSAREIVAILPVDFQIDGVAGIVDPKGYTGSILKVRGIIITVPVKNVYSVLSLLESIGIETVEISLSSIGDMYALKDKFMNNKVGAIVNIGSETTTVSLYNKTLPLKSSIIQLGGSSVDNDLMYMYKLDKESAIKIKERFALAHKMNANVGDLYECIDINGESIKVNQYEVSEVVQARLEELMGLVKQEIEILTNRELEYIVFTGGISNMHNFNEIIGAFFGTCAIIGNVKIVGLRDNKYSTAIGNMIYFINKLELKGKNYSMLSRSEEEEMSSVKRNIASGSETMLGKVFGYFFNE